MCAVILRKEIRGRVIKYTVNENGCHIPLLKPQPNGYVCVRLGKGKNRKTFNLHRVAFEDYYGIKADGVVMHHCDNPACFNPEHLGLGTQADNMLDAKIKGRLKRKKGANQGSKNGNAKITEEQAKEIFLSTGTYKEIAEKFGVSVNTVSDIKNRIKWRHVTEELIAPPKATKRGRPRTRKKP